VAGSFDLEKFIAQTNAEAEEAAKAGILDPVKYSCGRAEKLDGLYRPTFFKLQKGAKSLLTIGDWIVDPDDEITDIVHICDGEFQSPIVLVPKNKKRDIHILGCMKTTMTQRGFNSREEWDIVCVTCAAKPTEDVHVVIELLQKRKDNINGKESDKG